MARTDILLDPDNINAVAPDGSLNIATSPDVFTSSDEDREPDIRLTPSESSLQLGGGTGEEWSPSTVSLFNEGAPRIYLTSGLGKTSAPETNPEEQVFTVRTESGNEKTGILEMGKVGEGIPTIKLNAGRSLIRLGTTSDPGRLWLRGESTRTISLEGEEATIEVGGAKRVDGQVAEDGIPGSIELRNSKGTGTVKIEGEADNDTEASMIALGSSNGGVSIQADGGSDGGKIELMASQDNAAVTIDGGTGTLVLGQNPLLDPSRTQTMPDILKPEMGSSPAPINGELWLNDGAGKMLGLKAENGTVGLGPSSDSFEEGGLGLVLNPGEGIFSVVDSEGNAVFRIDTQAETIEIAEGYSQNGM